MLGRQLQSHQSTPLKPGSLLGLLIAVACTVLGTGTYYFVITIIIYINGGPTDIASPNPPQSSPTEAASLEPDTGNPHSPGQKPGAQQGASDNLLGKLAEAPSSLENPPEGKDKSSEVDVSNKPFQYGENNELLKRKFANDIDRLQAMDRLLNSFPHDQGWAMASRVETLEDMISTIEKNLKFANYIKYEKRTGFSTTDFDQFQAKLPLLKQELNNLNSRQQ